MPQNPVAPATNRPAPTKALIPQKPRVGHNAQRPAQQDQAARRHLHLTHQLQRLLAVGDDRQARLLPSIQTARQNVRRAVDAGSQPVAVPRRAVAAAAHEDHVAAGLEAQIGALKSRQRRGDGAGNMFACVLVRLTNIDQNGLTGLQTGGDIGGRQRDQRIHRFFLRREAALNAPRAGRKSRPTPRSPSGRRDRLCGKRRRCRSCAC